MNKAELKKMGLAILKTEIATRPIEWSIIDLDTNERSEIYATRAEAITAIEENIIYWEF